MQFTGPQAMPTHADKQAYFELALADAVERGQRPRKSQMLSIDVLYGMFDICDRWPDVDPKAVQDIKERQAVHMDWLTDPDEKDGFFVTAFADAYQHGKRPDGPQMLDEGVFRLILDMCDQWPNLHGDTLSAVLDAQDAYMERTAPKRT
ncbi:hypothetical protein A5642_15640 [Mycolicibacterium mucogenicum]|jgi:hypothetical protein|uniref:Uncharacterized protein n=1 Tax=Mycolicibacterium mucogenicum TaxID=56689 RepID=A0A1A0MV90_MYCMU|nr:hypothetical protein [Mycolicibacterium mucogenicum]OBA88971.1 hypothetical protein A5642_15640 [Mycolicibacterium mucogenicum]